MPNTAAMVLGCSSQAFCMALARAATSFNPSANSMAPAATRALNSPSEWPATMLGWKASPRTFAFTTLCRKIAGCVTLVCFRSASLPLNITFVRLKPSRSLACSNQMRALLSAS
jgi:hypothetical protein